MLRQVDFHSKKVEVNPTALYMVRHKMIDGKIVKGKTIGKQRTLVIQVSILFGLI